MPSPRYPSLFQINTRVRLTELSATLGRKTTLDDIPDAELDGLAGMGFDWVWLLSVWQTGPAAQAISRANPVWRREFEETLPDLKDEDIAGSGFAIQRYTVHRDLGGDAALARLRQRMKRRGLKLMLDFVPNHMAPDHPWVEEHPDYFVAGTEEKLAAEPQNYARGGKPDPRLRPGPVLRRLARYAAARLRQPGIAASHDRRAGENRRAMRRGALRHGHAGLARRLRTHLGHPARSLLAEGDRVGPAETSGLPVHGRGLLGPGMDSPAAGFRHHLRQAALRPPRVGRRAPGPRAPPRGPRLPGPPGPLPREPRRAAGRRHVRARGAPGRRRDHVSRTRPAVLPSGAVRRAEEAHLTASRPGARRISGQGDRGVLRPSARRPPEARREERGMAVALLPAGLGRERILGFLHRLFLAGIRRRADGGRRELRAPSEPVLPRTCRSPNSEDRSVRLRDSLGSACYPRDGNDLLERGLYLDLPPWSYHAFDMEVSA